MLHVFIDTNVYLTFYSFTAEDLEELRKLIVAINGDELRLWTTEQVRHELRRNREGRVSESIESLRKMKPPEGVPQMARNLPEFQALLEARRELGRRVNAIEDRLSREFADECLAADEVLRELMDVAEEIEVSDGVLEAARRRVDVGNPPGKKGSYGDAINWECLLASCPTGEDLFFVTGDADYVSPMSGDQIAGYLAREWRDSKSADIRLYRRISAFFHDNFRDIELASELEKELRIRRLVNSFNFDQTHKAIRQLSGYTEFSDDQARELFDAAISNSQIRWISHDPDVQEFFQELVARYGHLFDAAELERFQRYFGPEEGEEPMDEEEMPF